MAYGTPSGGDYFSGPMNALNPMKEIDGPSSEVGHFVEIHNRLLSRGEAILERIYYKVGAISTPLNPDKGVSPTGAIPYAGTQVSEELRNANARLENYIIKLGELESSIVKVL